MQFYRVVVRVKKLNGYDNAYEETEFYPVYANSPEDAANSVCMQKKRKKEDVVAVSYEEAY
jgi:hypothetical protein